MSRLIAVEAIGSPGNVLDQRVVALPERVFDLLPAACVCDRYGLILRYNRRAAELWGRAPRLGEPAEPFFGSNHVSRRDGGPLPESKCPLAEVLRTGIPVRDREVTI